MTISLITSTLGRREILGRLLTSLEQQSYRDFQIIIVDQNPDGYLDAVLAGHRQTLNLHHIRSPKGVSRGRNAGLQASTGEILAFPDDDCWYPPELLSQAIALLDAHPDHDAGPGTQGMASDVLAEVRRRLKSLQPMTHVVFANS